MSPPSGLITGTMISTRVLVPAGFVLLLGFSGFRSLTASPTPLWVSQMAAVQGMTEGNPPQDPGTFPSSWINGVDCDTEPSVQVHAYNDDTYIIRQSKCETFEAPFWYLLFGEDTALLMDTGANPNAPVWEPVDQVVRDWLKRNNRTTIDLIVAHTHHHFDHIQGDSQFVGQEFVSQIVAPNSNAFGNFWGFQDYPNDVPTIDLGNRVIDVLGTPGHHPDTATLYDRNTQILFTNDIIYPGHLFVFSQNHWFDFAQSLRRMVDWASKNPVSWVVGCHIEYSDTPFQPYAYTTAAHPTEAPLQFPPSILVQVLRGARILGSNPECTIYDEFVIHPVYKCGITWNG